MIKNRMRRVRVPCPESIKDCAVAHYKWVPVKEDVDKRLEEIRKKEREEYLKLLEEHGITEEEDEAMTDIMHRYDFEW